MRSFRLAVRASWIWFSSAIAVAALLCAPAGYTQNGSGASASPFDKLRFREIGPATPAGRIDDFEIGRAHV